MVTGLLQIYFLIQQCPADQLKVSYLVLAMYGEPQICLSVCPSVTFRYHSENGLTYRHSFFIIR